VLCVTGCQRESKPSQQRIAFLPFENLTGDAALNWISNAAPAIVEDDLAGVPGLVAMRVPQLSDAYLSRATRFVHGYFTGSASSLHFAVEVEDAALHKFAEPSRVSGDVLTAMNAAAKNIAPGAHQFPTANPEAVVAWGRGEFDRAVTLDPDFGLASLAWAEKLQRGGDPARAIEVSTQALDRPNLRTAMDRARLALFVATLRHDLPARVKALQEMVAQAPSDAALLQALANLETTAHHFREAAAHDRELLKLAPSIPNLLNTTGYAEAFAGDLDAARKTFEEYGRQPGQKANSLDSLGEALFMTGKFAEAENDFLEAHKADPALLAGADLLKAAYAHWLAGTGKAAELKGADALMAQYLKFRLNQHDVLAAWREASWLWVTGRRDQAMAKLAELPNKQLAAQQTAVWHGKLQLPKDLDTLKQRYESTAPASDAQIRLMYASALVEAGKKDEARALLEFWPMPWAPGEPVLESWVLPTFIELRTAVGLPAQ
jgi:tetratricopeptide (TPR) repeat protein